jgi:hypothetical protein
MGQTMSKKSKSEGFTYAPLTVAELKNKLTLQSATKKAARAEAREAKKSARLDEFYGHAVQFGSVEQQGGKSEWGRLFCKGLDWDAISERTEQAQAHNNKLWAALGDAFAQNLIDTEVIDVSDIYVDKTGVHSPIHVEFILQTISYLDFLRNNGIDVSKIPSKLTEDFGLKEKALADQTNGQLKIKVAGVPYAVPMQGVEILPSKAASEVMNAIKFDLERLEISLGKEKTLISGKRKNFDFYGFLYHREYHKQRFYEIMEEKERLEKIMRKVREAKKAADEGYQGETVHWITRIYSDMYSSDGLKHFIKYSRDVLKKNEYNKNEDVVFYSSTSVYDEYDYRNITSKARQYAASVFSVDRDLDSYYPESDETYGGPSREAKFKRGDLTVRLPTLKDHYNWDFSLEASGPELAAMQYLNSLLPPEKQVDLSSYQAPVPPAVEMKAGGFHRSRAELRVSSAGALLKPGASEDSPKRKPFEAFERQPSRTAAFRMWSTNGTTGWGSGEVTREASKGNNKDVAGRG